MRKVNKVILLLVILLACLVLRTVFLGYNTLGHGEAELAQNISYVMPYLHDYPYLQALWRLWHIFLIEHNPMFTTIFPINFTLARFFGINEFTIRFNAVIGGMISVLIIYLLFRRYADEITTFFALTLIAFNPFMIIYNRFAHHDSMQIALVLTGILFLDSYCRNRKLPFLFVSSICFSLGFLMKMQAIVFISILLFLYFLYFGLKIRDICLIIVIAAVFTVLLFIDQTNAFFGAVLKTTKVALKNEAFLSGLPEMLVRMTVFFAKAHIKYFEITALPVIICLLFWNKINNKLFKLFVTFSIVYFIILILQGRPFFRYLQAGVITISAALAFPLRKYAVRKYYYLGSIALIIFISLSLFIHRSYASAVYHHIPYKYIAKRTNELRGKGRILIYGKNSESEYYLSPTGNFIHDESVNPCQEGIIKTVADYEIIFDSVRKIPPTESVLFDPEIVRSGDVLVVTGMQMIGGEPAPRLRGYDGKGFRIYRHELKMPREFYKKFMVSKKMQDNFIILEKIFLTNNSKELAALILRKK